MHQNKNKCWQTGTGDIVLTCTKIHPHLAKPDWFRNNTSPNDKLTAILSYGYQIKL